MSNSAAVQKDYYLFPAYIMSGSKPQKRKIVLEKIVYHRYNNVIAIVA
jgi:hypothetical protein